MSAEQEELLGVTAGRFLLQLARYTIGRQLGVASGPPPAPPADQQSVLAQRRGVFVTLKQAGQLRGCIGSLEARLPLTEGVAENAVKAAFHDPRFAPLSATELPASSLEVSVLTPPQPLPYDGPEELLSRLQPGRDGVLLSKGGLSATFLPQVWEQLPEPEAFLAHLCRKAGLSAEAWRRGDLEVMTYQVQAFTEDELAG
ncbi:MAG: AmmeMemoRadiSam system protein A [Desulfurivibrio sp.]|nr:AmmeMemoRadiSam system protein A [Desulfurivibrio sp.]